MGEEQFYRSAYRGGNHNSEQETQSRDKGAFGAAAEDYTDRGFDLNEQLIQNKPATFFMRVSGNSMVDAGIYDDDIVIVDKSIKAQNGKIVIAVLDGELLIRRYERTLNKLRLVPETSKLSAIEIGEFSDCKIWGVVTCVIRMIDSSLQSFRNNGVHKETR